MQDLLHMSVDSGDSAGVAALDGARVVEGYTKYADVAQPFGKRKKVARYKRHVRALAAAGIAVLAIAAAVAFLPKFYPTAAGSEERISAKSAAVGLSKVAAVGGKLDELPFVLKVGEETVSEVPLMMATTWLHIGKGLDVSLDEDAALAWVSEELGPMMTSVDGDRSYRRPDGKKVTVSGGTYGWEMDVAAFAQAFESFLQGKTAATLEIPMTQRAEVWAVHGQDWGKRYIDVDLDEQHARMYDDNGKLVWESDIVSGSPYSGHFTPTGVYTINENKGVNQTLIGFDEDHDGEPDYKTPVNYWMPFVDNLVAFHDATWRWGFGGAIYQYNGSHGCVNLPYSAAEQLYDLTEVGDVVVVHQTPVEEGDV